MFAVVAIHSTAVFDQSGFSRPGVNRLLLTPLKFGTIAFFLMSGFLAGRGLETSQPLRYLGRRIQRIFFPWTFWVAAMVAGLLATDLAHHRFTFGANQPFFQDLGHWLFYTLTSTAFWFVPNLLISMAILLVFRRWHENLGFGAVLLALSLFYAVNIYMSWLPSAHTEALLGFVFYLWLGVFAARKQRIFDGWLAHISFFQLSFAVLVTGLLAYGEAQFLHHRHVLDATNSLRLSNQIFSLCTVLLIYKFPTATWPRFVNVRKDTFGIYLSHSLVLSCLWRVLKVHIFVPTVHRFAANRLGCVVLWATVLVGAYLLSLLVTKLIASQPALGWLVGMPQSRPAARSVSANPAEFARPTPLAVVGQASEGKAA